ncbi:hypothetical protein PC116_g24549 [Phytophthora cactorum]|nr:hypothetical protein PC120_g23944 [Phytophthora cactorum]KAG3132607.1 hypothetical protein C6341_g22843 [Phytophthora cactorum]KAG4227053.1 hypothetical protein PC116_g24549 [Phytophthora cactorum]
MAEKQADAVGRWGWWRTTDAANLKVTASWLGSSATTCQMRLDTAVMTTALPSPLQRSLQLATGVAIACASGAPPVRSC